MSKSEEVMRCQRRKKIFAIDTFGGKCQLCGYNKCINALVFHHIDPTKKEAEPCYIIMRWSWKRALKELKKCILVCANCHAELHYKNKTIDFLKYIKSWITKNCKICNEQFETKNDKQKYCKPNCSNIGQRKVERPSNAELAKLIEIISWTELGKKFGVSDNAVRKWAKKYELIK